MRLNLYGIEERQVQQLVIAVTILRQCGGLDLPCFNRDGTSILKVVALKHMYLINSLSIRSLRFLNSKASFHL